MAQADDEEARLDAEGIPGSSLQVCSIPGETCSDTTLQYYNRQQMRKVKWQACFCLQGHEGHVKEPCPKRTDLEGGVLSASNSDKPSDKNRLVCTSFCWCCRAYSRLWQSRCSLVLVCADLNEIRQDSHVLVDSCSGHRPLCIPNSRSQH